MTHKLAFEKFHCHIHSGAKSRKTLYTFKRSEALGVWANYHNGLDSNLCHIVNDRLGNGMFVITYLTLGGDESHTESILMDSGLPEDCWLHGDPNPRIHVLFPHFMAGRQEDQLQRTTFQPKLGKLLQYVAWEGNYYYLNPHGYPFTYTCGVNLFKEF